MNQTTLFDQHDQSETGTVTRLWSVWQTATEEERTAFLDRVRQEHLLRPRQEPPTPPQVRRRRSGGVSA